VRRGAEVLVSARSYGDLIDHADATDIDWAEVIVTYVDRADVVRSGWGFSFVRFTVTIDAQPRRSTLDDAL
jgi:hypothetical protein